MSNHALPNSCNVKTNIGAQFLRLVDHSFPKEHSLINRTTIKIGFRCLSNLGQVIANYNSKLMKEDDAQNLQDLQTAQNLRNNCNCKQKVECPLNAQCQEKK